MLILSILLNLILLFTALHFRYDKDNAESMNKVINDSKTIMSKQFKEMRSDYEKLQELSSPVMSTVAKLRDPSTKLVSTEKNISALLPSITALSKHSSNTIESLLSDTNLDKLISSLDFELKELSNLVCSHSQPRDTTPLDEINALSLDISVEVVRQGNVSKELSCKLERLRELTSTNSIKEDSVSNASLESSDILSELFTILDLLKGFSTTLNNSIQLISIESKSLADSLDELSSYSFIVKDLSDHVFEMILAIQNNVLQYKKILGGDPLC